MEKSRVLESTPRPGASSYLDGDLNSLIEQQVGRRFEQLESRLIRDLQVLGDKAVEESARALNQQLGQRLHALEGASSFHSAALASIGSATRKAEQDVKSAVTHIEQTLSEAGPGFQLDPPSHSRRLTERRALVKEDCAPENENTGYPSVYCPRCTSTHIRRANRANAFEHFLRLFSIAPFRCRACRYRFYRLSFATAAR
jgi:predicted Zn-ribbon and HTH transcriptional regulator